MDCPGCFATIPDTAKFCPECGIKLTGTGTSVKLEDSVLNRSPGAGSSYSPVINVSSNISSEEQKNLRCVNCNMEISKDNKPLICMECGAKFCENCEGFYRHEVRQRGEKPLCYKCYTATYGDLSKNGSTVRTPDKPVYIENTLAEVRCPNCATLNRSDNLYCVNCGSQISPKSNIGAVIQPPTNPQVSQPAPGKTSAAWWLLPIFMTWVGGLIAFLVLRDTDKNKAKRLLIFGIVITVIWIVLYIILVVAAGLLSGY